MTTTTIDHINIVYAYHKHDNNKCPYPIVMLHGMGASHEMWQPQIDYFSQFYTTLAITLPGHGKSEAEKTPQMYSIERYAHLTIQLLDQLNISSAVFLANSMGGVIAYHIKSIACERIKMLVTHGCTPKLSYSNFGSKLIAIADRIMLRIMGVRGMMNTLAKNVTKDLIVQAMLIDIMSQADPDMIPATHVAISNYDYMATFTNNQSPVIILKGEHDKGINKCIDNLEHELNISPLTEIIYLADVGHILNLENPLQYNKIVEDKLHHYLISTSSG